ncbi:MAG: hypothetical protein KBD15_03935 [Candidatus Magasanikbacteria bacterium]|jgi:hypothetical protein|nr:hypothetical protein [Candidatus Magasanikbacteria bacterium]
MKKIALICGMGLLASLSIVFIVFFSRQTSQDSAKTILLPKLSQEQHQERCRQHTAADTCEADPYCQSIELTPVCIQSNGEQVCLDGGYQCSPKPELTKEE